MKSKFDKLQLNLMKLSFLGFIVFAVNRTIGAYIIAIPLVINIILSVIYSYKMISKLK